MLQGRFGMLQTPSCLICHAFSSSFFFFIFLLNPSPSPPFSLAVSLVHWFDLDTHFSHSPVCFSLCTSLYIFTSLSGAMSVPSPPRLTVKPFLLNALYSDLFLMSVWRAWPWIFSLSLSFSLLQVIRSWSESWPPRVKSVQSAFLGSSSASAEPADVRSAHFDLSDI